MPALPRREPSGDLVLKVLEMDSFQLLDRERQAEVAHREGGTHGREALHDIIEVQATTPDGRDKCFLEGGFHPNVMNKRVYEDTMTA